MHLTEAQKRTMGEIVAEKAVASTHTPQPVDNQKVAEPKTLEPRTEAPKVESPKIEPKQELPENVAAVKRENELKSNDDFSEPKKEEQKIEVTEDELDPHLAWLKEDDKPKDEVKTNEDSAKYKNIAEEYQSLMEDPEINAFIEYKKSGKGDVVSFIKEMKIIDTDKITVEEMITEQAKAMGFEGEELEEAVAEQLDRYEGLSRIEKKEKDSELRAKYKNKTNGALSSYTSRMVEQRQRIEKIENESFIALEKKITSLVGSKFRGMPIDKTMAAEIQKLAPKYSEEILDEKGNLVGYDLEEGVRLAILSKYEKPLLKTTYNLAKTKGTEETLKERLRPDENISHRNQTSFNDPTERQNAVEKAIAEKAAKRNR